MMISIGTIAVIIALLATLFPIQNDLGRLRGGNGEIQGQIEGLRVRQQSQIDGLQAQIEGLQEGLQGQIDGLQGQIEGLLVGQTSLGARIGSLESRMGNMEDRLGRIESILMSMQTAGTAGGQQTAAGS